MSIELNSITTSKRPATNSAYWSTLVIIPKFNGNELSDNWSSQNFLLSLSYFLCVSWSFFGLCLSRGFVMPECL